MPYSVTRAVKVAAKLRDVRIIGVEVGVASGGQRLDELVLGARDAILRFKVLQMREADVGNHAFIRRGNLRKARDLTRVRHAHLDDGEVMLRLQPQQLHGQAKVVVQIAQRLQHLVARAEQMRNAFL